MTMTRFGMPERCKWAALRQTHRASSAPPRQGRRARQRQVERGYKRSRPCEGRIVEVTMDVRQTSKELPIPRHVGPWVSGALLLPGPGGAKPLTVEIRPCR